MKAQQLRKALSTFIWLSTFLVLLSFGYAQFNEAPSLRALVEQGALPPVEERLPQNPRVVPVVERIGEYGGEWRTALVGSANQFWFYRTLGYENLVLQNPTWTEVIPNLAESFEVSEDSTQYTFYLREGTKWSDGHPFTADDIMFWYESVLMNNALTPVVPGWLTAGGEPVVVEKVDDYTIRFRFSQPYGLFLPRLASTGGDAPTRYPRHYLEQFHADHNPEGIQALVQEAGLDDWVALFARQSDQWLNTELPRFHAWVFQTVYDGATSIVRAERNPYYFKVDPEGNQLPYLDRKVYDVVESAEIVLLKVLNGEINMMDQWFNTPSNKPLIIDGQERGGYRLFDQVHSRMNEALLHFNLTHHDPVKREIFQNRDFRVGMSHAIDRQEIIDLIFVGQGEPWQAAPHREAPFFNERLAKQYTDYDPDLANQHLDTAGYAERDAQGYRLGPDGQRISLTIELYDGQDWADIVELVATYWEAIGIEARVRVLDRGLWETRHQNYEHDVTVFQGTSGLQDALLEPAHYLPVSTGSYYAVPWAQWYTSRGQRGEAPPESVQEHLALYDQLLATGNEAEQVELMRQILEMSAEQFYVLGVALPTPRWGIAANNFRNVPEVFPAGGGAFAHPFPTNPSQYFIDSSIR